MKLNIYISFRKVRQTTVKQTCQIIVRQICCASEAERHAKFDIIYIKNALDKFLLPLKISGRNFPYLEERNKPQILLYSEPKQYAHRPWKRKKKKLCY